jgi:hypothetical protein
MRAGNRARNILVLVCNLYVARRMLLHETIDISRSASEPAPVCRWDGEEYVDNIKLNLLSVCHGREDQEEANEDDSCEDDSEEDRGYSEDVGVGGLQLAGEEVHGAREGSLEIAVECVADDEGVA